MRRKQLSIIASPTSMPYIVLAIVLMLVSCAKAEEGVRDGRATGDSNQGQVGTSASPPVSGAEATAVAAALSESAHIVQDSVVQKSTAEAMTWGEAEAKLGPRGASYPSDTPVWLVSLIGVFRPPGGLVLYDRPEGDPPVCSEIEMVIDDGTKESLLLIYRESDSCS